MVTPMWCLPELVSVACRYLVVVGSPWFQLVSNVDASATDIGKYCLGFLTMLRTKVVDGVSPWTSMLQNRVAVHG